MTSSCFASHGQNENGNVSIKMKMIFTFFFIIFTRGTLCGNFAKINAILLIVLFAFSEHLCNELYRK